MRVVVHEDIEEFERLARPLYEADPVRHTYALTVLDGLLRERDPAASLITVQETDSDPAAAMTGAAMTGGGMTGAGTPRHGATDRGASDRRASERAASERAAVNQRSSFSSAGRDRRTADRTGGDMGGACVGAVLRSPAHPILVSGLPARWADAVEQVVAEVDPECGEVSGPMAEAEAFAAARSARIGATVRVLMAMRLFALDSLVTPTAVPGSARCAGEADVEILGAWRAAFALEDRGAWSDRSTPQEVVSRSLRWGYGELIWEVDGAPVAQASARRPVAGMCRIGPVYTEPAHRRRGYGAAVTAAATRWALDAGARQVVLFTDLANPTTNALYPRIGFRPVHDAVELRLDDRVGDRLTDGAPAAR